MSCSSKTSDKSVHIKPVNELNGIYDFYTIGNKCKCETIKHIFEFKVHGNNSYFLYHTFCHPFNGDSTGESSLLKPYSMIGRWAYTENLSIIQLIGDNRDTLKIKILNNKIEDILDTKNNSISQKQEIFFHNNS